MKVQQSSWIVIENKLAQQYLIRRFLEVLQTYHNVFEMQKLFNSSKQNVHKLTIGKLQSQKLALCDLPWFGLVNHDLSVVFTW